MASFLKPSRVVIVLLVIGPPLLVAYGGRLALFCMNTASSLDRSESRTGIAYGALHRQRLDVYKPPGAQGRPIIVFWYGGAWMMGSKSQYRFVGSTLADSGYVAVLPDYRLYPAASFPAFIEDGARAVRWAQEHAREYGGDPRKIFLAGHSAGAHIAATLAFDDRYLEAAGVSHDSIRGFIGLSGPYAIDPLLRKIYNNVFPIPPNEEAGWLPFRLIGPGRPRALLVHGTDDWMVFHGRSSDFAAKLRARNVAVDLRIYEGRSHQDTVAALSRPWRFRAPVLGEIRRFIDE